MGDHGNAQGGRDVGDDDDGEFHDDGGGGDDEDDDDDGDADDDGRMTILATVMYNAVGSSSVPGRPRALQWPQLGLNLESPQPLVVKNNSV